MRHTTHTTQVYSLFGAGYVLEAHGPGPFKGSKHSPGKRGALVVALLLAVTTAAGAIASTSRNRAPKPDLWKQQTPSIVMKLPGGFGVEDALY
jgi:hypothetical protein